jgi:hypothetical protein
MEANYSRTCFREKYHAVFLDTQYQVKGKLKDGLKQLGWDIKGNLTKPITESIRIQ